MAKATTEPLRKPDKIHALTSLRFFAALFVVCYHAIGSFFIGIMHDGLLGRFLNLGFVSVSFFFLLSGYILGVVYLRREKPVAAKPFLLARFARVYPLFFLTLVLDTPNLFLSRLATYGTKAAILKTAVTFAGTSVMLHAWITVLGGIDNPNWSLAVETVFYLSFPILGVALWKLRGLRLSVVAAVVYLGGQVAVYVVAPHVSSEVAKALPLLHLTTFALGILLARWQTLARQSSGSTSQVALWAAALIAVVAFAAVLYWSPILPLASMYDGLLAPIFLLIVWAFSHSEWFPARILNVGWLIVLGEASFGLYLFHVPILHLFERLHMIHAPAFFPIYLGISIAVSVLSFYFFETPARKWILKHGHIRTKETMEVASDVQ